MLGARQKEKLQRFRGPYTEPVRITIRLHPYRAYTREFGSGHDVTVSLTYLTDNTEDLAYWLSTCATLEAGERKAREIAHYLLSLGVSRSSIKVIHTKKGQG